MISSPRLSVIIITFNEIKHIGACLDSVQPFADEIIVVDSGSTDGTPELCREKGAQVTVTTDWPGFGQQKNRALDLAKGEWVLSIDADERVTPELAEDIKNVLLSPTYPAYQIPRQSNYCGRWMKHSGWSPDYVLRLFRREGTAFSDDKVHERVIFSDQRSIGRLPHPFLHYSYDTIEDVIDRMNHYSTAGAEMKLAKGQKSSLKKAIFHGVWAFFRTYILQRGFLDGREGFMLAVSNAEGVYYRYLKMLVLL